MKQKTEYDVVNEKSRIIFIASEFCGNETSAKAFKYFSNQIDQMLDSGLIPEVPEELYKDAWKIVKKHKPETLI